MGQPLKINKLFGTGRIAALLARTRALQEMDRLLVELLPPPLNRHCHILSIRNNILAIAADSPAWAARLRFHAPLLVKQLAARLPDRRYTVHVRVRPPETPPPPTSPRRIMHCGMQGSSALQQAAQSVSDPGLKTALLRLAGRNGRRG